MECLNWCVWGAFRLKALRRKCCKPWKRHTHALRVTLHRTAGQPNCMTAQVCGGSAHPCLTLLLVKLLISSNAGKMIAKQHSKFTSLRVPGGSLGINRYDLETMTDLAAEEFSSGRVFLGSAPASGPAAGAATRKAPPAKRPRMGAKVGSAARAGGAGGGGKAVVLARGGKGPKRAMFNAFAPGALVLQWPAGGEAHAAAAESGAGVDAEGRGHSEGAGCVTQADGSSQMPVVVDPHLANVLRPHQREGVKFLWECCAGMRSIKGEGCILADEMGLGKTLQTITLVYTMLKQSVTGAGLASKVIIACPSTLVGNWKKEFGKWLGSTRCKPAAVTKTGKVAEGVVHDFVHGRSSMYPVLILSYEMCRKFSKALASARVGLLVCDEGHRLKNSGGNQTIAALAALPTRRKVLLTGTPVQNDLLEFYAMCSFVNPAELGDPTMFRRLFAKPIQDGRDTRASPAEVQLARQRADELARITSQFVLRRTNELLEKFLPPKTEVCVFVQPSQLQLEAYQRMLGSSVVRRILSRAGRAAGGGKGSTASALVLINALRKAMSHPDLLYGQVYAGSEDVTAAIQGRGLPLSAALAATVCSHPGQEGNAAAAVAMEGSSPGADPAAQEDDEPSSDGSDDEDAVLEGGVPVGGRKRGRGGFAAPRGGAGGGSSAADDDGDVYASLVGAYPAEYVFNEAGAALASLHPRDAEAAGVVAPPPPHDLDRAVAWSGKLRFLDTFLHHIRQVAPGDKCVIVSNFTQFLDVVATLAGARGYPFLRLDGSVSSDKRMALVNTFNGAPARGAGAVFLFLLSSKSGGAGLNLIGANRLLMCDADWNPATDRQAEARVWRDGQRKHTFVYRICTVGTLEEKIIQRQIRKGEVAGAVVDDDADAGRNFSGAELKDVFAPYAEPTLEALQAAGCGSCATFRLLHKDREGTEADAVGLSAQWPPYAGASTLTEVDPPLAAAAEALGDLHSVPYVQHASVNLHKLPGYEGPPASQGGSASNTLEREAGRGDAAAAAELAASADTASDSAPVPASQASSRASVTLDVLALVADDGGDLL